MTSGIVGIMEKDFGGWNKKKQHLDEKVSRYDFYYNEREVWWWSVGINVGVETDGKNEHFERPVLVVKKFNGLMFLGVPLTANEKTGRHYLKVFYDTGVSFAMLSQIRIFSSKRMLRKLGVITEESFKQTLIKISEYFVSPS
jgi:mRNA interferase MazF